MVIQNYRKCIEMLRKLAEKFMLIQALHKASMQTASWARRRSSGTTAQTQSLKSST